MNSKERVLTTLNHKEPDRVPLFLGAGNATGIQIQAFRKLKKHLGFNTPDRFLYDWPELGTADLDEEFLQWAGSDVRGVFDRHPTSTLVENASRAPGDPFYDSWGIGQIQIEPGNWYPGIHPLTDAITIQELNDYTHWPDMDDPSRFAHLRGEAQKLAEANQYAVMATPWLLFPFERAIMLQGMEAFFMNLVMRPEFSMELLRRCVEYCKQLMGHVLDACGEYIDVIKIGDDLGTNTNLLISPKMYRQFLKPIHADYIQFIKERTSAKVFFHSDGNIVSLLDDLIEIGVDILNPIQTSAGEMGDLPALKKRYGQALTLCGAIDTTSVLPLGTPTQVRDEVRRVIEHLAPGGGFIVAAVHIIQSNVPPENIVAMIDAIQEFGEYR